MNQRPWLGWLIASAMLIGWTGGAQAGEGVGGHGFQSPTGNIHCWLDDLGVATGQYPVALRCDILQIDSRRLPKPKGCDLDWGQAFGLSQAASPGSELLCVSDSIADVQRPVLPYGGVWAMAGFECRSARSGVTCTNAAGRGFSLSRSLQQLF